jgi:transposase
MSKRDGRKLDHRTLEEIRIRAVQQVESGESPEVVIKALGFTRPGIYEWLAKYREGGIDALKARKAPGRKPKLKGHMVRWIYNAITMKSPLQFKFEFALWTRPMIAAIIFQRYGIRLSDVSVGRLLAKLGLTCQRPLYRATEQSPSLVAQWLRTEYPAIKARAEAENAEIFFGDESAIRSDHHAGTTWAPKGQTPVVRTTGQRFRLNMLSAISSKGSLNFMVCTGRVAAPQFCEFLDRLMHGRRRKVFLIVDGHAMHKARRVQEHVARWDGKLELFYLPPYSPELNPDELVWNHVKTHTVGRALYRTFEELKQRVESFLERLKATPYLVRSFFCAPETCYAL